MRILDKEMSENFKRKESNHIGRKKKTLHKKGNPKNASNLRREPKPRKAEKRAQKL